MDRFTALHRVLGRGRGPITDEMIDALVAAAVPESADIDFKSALPPTSNVTSTDFPKDIAAMANSGGGIIVYGVDENDKRAAGRTSVTLSEGHERSLRQAAVSAISPPILHLQIDRLGQADRGCVVITVPPSEDGPHLIYRNDYFGAPLRNDADTVWMRERQIETLYRARFDRRHERAEQLEQLYVQALRGLDTEIRAWFVAVAAPRSPAVRQDRMTRGDAETCFTKAVAPALALAGKNAGPHPLEIMDRRNPRIGLRSWIVSSYSSTGSHWRDAVATVGDSGSVTLAAAVGRQRHQQGYWDGHEIGTPTIECALADFLGLLRATSKMTNGADYDLQVGIAWDGDEALRFLRPDPVLGYLVEATEYAPRVHFVPVSATMSTDTDDDEFHRLARELALDCVNQGGLAYTTAITAPESST